MDFLLSKLDESWGSLTKLVEKMNGLKRKLEGLNARKEDAESRTSTELRPRKKLKKEVELWFIHVERINSEIQDLQEKFRKSNAISRGFLKADVFQKTHEVEELLEQGMFHDSLVVDDPRWIGQVLPATTAFGGAAKVCMEEVWACLMDDDIHKIGVWGMGGVGKTTIMKLINNQLLKMNDKFGVVIWITVSKEMSIFKMQNRIARTMDKKLDEDEDETIRAGMVYEMLSKGKYVLILDDLWDKLSLEEVGIPEPSNGSKLLVTTRSLDVCHYLDCREVKLHPLSKRDARGLFLEKVGQDVLNHPDLLPIVDSVAKECDGLPLAIVTIAGSMKGVRDIHEWRNAFYELNRNLKSVNGMEEKVFHILQFSYDRLQDEKLKYCFLSCALYPEDFEIDMDELIKLWIAEGLVEEMDSTRIEIDRGHTILNKLINCSLIQNGTTGRVKLHDIVRDMALRIASVRPRFLVRAGMQLREIPDVQHWKEDLEKASFMKNLRLQFPSQMPPPKCQMLTTLLLSNCSISSIPECFFEQMHGLKILDLSDNLIESLPTSVSNLGSLNTLLLGGCKKLEKVPSFSKLHELKKLDLGGTNIKNIPHGIERLINLKYLDLSETEVPKIANGILAKFTSLQYLNCYGILVRGEEIGGLRKLEIFKGKFGDLNEWNSYAQALHAREYTRIFVGQLSGKYCLVSNEWIVFRGYSINICYTQGNEIPDKLCGCNGSNRDAHGEWIPVNVNIGLRGSKSRTHGIRIPDKLVELNGSTISFTHDIKIPSHIENLKMVDCFFDLRGEKEKPLFSWFVPAPLNIFSCLSEIEMFTCQNIKKLFPSKWVLHNLQNLVKLRVENCKNIEEIITSEEEINASFKFILPKLVTFDLWGLPELKSICGANGVVACDCIEKFVIENCPKLKRIPLHLPLKDDGQPSAPPSLKQIYITSSKWSQLEWDHPNAKSLLDPFLQIW
ncbi:hypothetical protein PTKIN_Ptkin14bG0098700 [Pterospermum kingtungense]